jgi:hypothetical protein
MSIILVPYRHKQITYKLHKTQMDRRVVLHNEVDDRIIVLVLSIVVQRFQRCWVYQHFLHFRVIWYAFAILAS